MAGLLVLTGPACDRTNPGLAPAGPLEAASPPAALPPTGDVDGPRELTVEVTGEGFQWRVRYPGPDRRLGTADDVQGTRDLHLPGGTDVTVELRSNDYLYSFRLPHVGLSEIAVPDLEFSLSFATDSAGSFELRGDQFCGYRHEGLRGQVVVHGREGFDDWLRIQSRN